MILVVAPEVTEYVSYRDNGFKATDGSAMLLNVRLHIRVIIALILDDHVAQGQTETSHHDILHVFWAPQTTCLDK